MANTILRYCSYITVVVYLMILRGEDCISLFIRRMWALHKHTQHRDMIEYHGGLLVISLFYTPSLFD